MHFTVQREAFFKPLQAVAGAVKSGPKISPILSNVLIKVQQDQLSFTTTDQEVELVFEGKLKELAIKDGAVTLSVFKLMSICSTLPEGEMLSILEEKDRIILRAGRSRFTLSTLPVNEFPSLSETVGDIQFSMTKKHLRSLIKETCFAMAEQDVRYYLNGMLLEVKNGHVYGVAADGHRLAFSKIAISMKDTKVIRIIVPRKGILELQRILDGCEEEIKVFLGSNHLRVITNDIQLTSKLLDGRFPDYERIISSNGDKIFIGHREALKQAFQRAIALAGTGSSRLSKGISGVQLRLTKGLLKLLTTNAVQEQVEEDLEVEYAGSELEIGFNIRYLIDFLNVIETETVKFTFSDSNSSARVEGVGAENGVYVIMPMKI